MTTNHSHLGSPQALAVGGCHIRLGQRVMFRHKAYIGVQAALVTFESYVISVYG